MAQQARFVDKGSDIWPTLKKFPPPLEQCSSCGSVSWPKYVLYLAKNLAEVAKYR